MKVPIDSSYPDKLELKICKFLTGHDCLVAADIDGFLHFFAVTPSPRKNEHLCKVNNVNTSQVGTEVNYPIRAMDFDSYNNVLYTGDEMGYVQRWDLSGLFSKLEEVSKKERKVVYKGGVDPFALDEGMGVGESAGGKKSMQSDSTFVTGIDAGGSAPKTKIEFNSGDVVRMYKWNAHTDTINWITYTPELDCLTSCSFDCNVYMWRWKELEDGKGEMNKIGSLVLGTERLWKIRIDKHKRT